MLTNLNNNNILQALSSGIPLFIIEYYPSLKPGVVVTPPSDDGQSVITPVEMSAQRGYIQCPVEISNGAPNQIMSFDQYHASFTEYYNSIIASFVNSNIKIQLSHIGVDTLYRNYKAISSTYTVGGLVNILEAIDYVRLDIDTNLASILRGIPELAVFGVSYRTFCHSVVRMFPEMNNALSLAGSINAYVEYLKLFEKTDRTLVDYPLLNNITIKGVSDQIAMMTQGIDPNIIRTAVREQNDYPELQNYIKFMINNNIPMKVAINLLAYHPSIINIALNGVRGGLKLPLDKELHLPTIFTIKNIHTSSVTSLGLL